MTIDGLSPDIPLGPFEGAALQVWSARGKNARLHASEACGPLRTKDVVCTTVRLDASVIARMCRTCASYGPWGRRETALRFFLDALTGVGLPYELTQYVTPDDPDGWTDEDFGRAADVLVPGTWPPADDEDDRWADHHEAREIRASAFHDWLRAAESLHRAYGVLASYPWLMPWAQDRLAQKTRTVDTLRVRAAGLVSPDALTEAASVSLLENPGGGHFPKSMLERVWASWQSDAEDSWSPHTRHRLAPYAVLDELEKRRKGREELLNQAREFIASSVEEARERVAESAGRPECRLMAEIPALEGPGIERHRSTWRSLAEWEQAVLATYLVDADWRRSVLSLRVPAIIAERILSDREALQLTYREATIGGPSSSDQPDEQDAFGPGILDDTPIADRRPVTAAHLRVLRAQPATAGQLYLVFSVESGAEILRLSEIEERYAAGWRGIMLAGEADLPDSLIQPWADGRHEPDGGDEHGWHHRVTDPQDPRFGQEFGMAEGEKKLARMASRFGRSATEPARSLRVLALARSVPDLRTLGHEYGDREKEIPIDVWYGLLASQRLDLHPFMPRRRPSCYGRPGLEAPLGILADVQPYTTNADPGVEGKAHSPYCGHARDRAVGPYYDMLTVADLLREQETINWCAACPGYAVRRLTGPQLAFYRAAHRLYDVHEELESGAERGARDAQTLLDELSDLAGSYSEASRYLPVTGEWDWRRLVQDLERRVESLAR